MPSNIIKHNANDTKQTQTTDENAILSREHLDNQDCRLQFREFEELTSSVV